MAKKKTIKIEEPAELKKAPLLRNNVPDPVPSVLSGLLRFSPDHIVRLIYDPDSKNFMLGDLSQNLVTNGVMGESGGASIPVVKVTIVNSMANTYSPNIGTYGSMTVENGIPCYQAISIPASESLTVDIPVFHLEEYNADICDMTLEVAQPYGGSLTYSDEVNCTYDSEGDMIQVTDASLPASITLTVASA